MRPAAASVLKQSTDIPIIVNVNLFSSGMTGQAGHAHHIPGYRNQETCSGSDLYFPNMKPKSLPDGRST
jgi:diadenosine tetraphosphate (Ap4A) HIT family hydrolase